MASLQDQLLKAGVINKGKAQKIRKDKQKQRKQKVADDPTTEESKLLAAKALEEKKQRDLERNKQLNAEAERKALQAQVNQWVTTAQLEPGGGDIPYQFVHNKVIKKIYVSALMTEELSRGRVAIVTLGDRYCLVPEAVGKRVLAAAPERFVLMNESAAKDSPENDEYADYKVPDDLMW